MTQSIIPSKVIQMAKAMLEAQREGKHLVIKQMRQTGRTMATKLARGEQVLPVDASNLSPN